MVAFTETLRSRCRKCRGKLASPTSNDHEAFCCRGCYEQFHRTHCRVCERTIKQPKRGQRFVCSTPKCKRAWKETVGLGRFARKPGHSPSADKSISEVTVPQHVLEPSKAVGWRIVAGPALSIETLQAATVPDGPNIQWSGGSFQRTETANKALLRKHAITEHERLIRHAFAIERQARWPANDAPEAPEPLKVAA